MKILIISTSLNLQSRSAAMARVAAKHLRKNNMNVELLKLVDLAIPFCDGGASYASPVTVELSRKVSEADAVILACPIYNYDVNAAAKNLIELTGKAWTGKVVGFILAAGGQGSFMSVMPFANSLMLDFRCVIVPRFVYTTGAAFDQNRQLTDPEVYRRIEELSTSVTEFMKRLAGMTDAVKGK